MSYDDMARDTEERYLIDILAGLQESYAKSAQPYIDRLAAIRSAKQPPPIYLTMEQAQALGFVPPNRC